MCVCMYITTYVVKILIRIGASFKSEVRDLSNSGEVVRNSAKKNWTATYSLYDCKTIKKAGIFLALQQ